MAEKAILGDKYEDTITAYIGTAISRHEYLDGSVFVTLQWRGIDENKLPFPYHTCPEGQLVPYSDDSDRD